MTHSATAAPSRADNLLASLRLRTREFGSVLVCFSGGIDSTLVLAVASEQLGKRAIGMTAVSPSLPARDRVEAARIAAALGAHHRLVNSHELSRPGYVANGPDRCFHCKSELYDIATEKSQSWDLAVIANGTNADDTGDYRPGLAAAKNANVKSPLLELGFTKQDVRDVAQLLGVRSWNKPAAACLSSRLPYGTAVTPERLAQVETLEAALLDLGLVQVRVRYHENLARIEVAQHEIEKVVAPGLREQILKVGQKCGFQYVTIDLAGYRMGSHNELLRGRRLPML